MSLTISDPFCQQFNAALAAFDADLSRALPFTGRKERDTLVKLVAGLTVVVQCIASKVPPTGELNAVLAARLGNGYSWLNCLQFLSGARAREAFAKHEAVLRTLLSPALADFAREALPSMPTTLQAIMADARTARGGHGAC